VIMDRKRMKAKLKKERRKALPHFQLYVPQAQAMTQWMRKFERLKAKPTWEDVLALGLTIIPDFGCTTDCHILLNEMWWRDAGMPTIIVEDPRLLEMMYRAKVEIVPEAINVPGLIAFGFPRGVELDGIAIDGCMFGELDVQESRDYATRKFVEVTGRAPNFVPTGAYDPLQHNPEGKAFYVTSMVKEQIGQSYLRTWFRKPDAAHVCDDGWVEANLANDKWLIDREYKQQRVYFKLLYALCIYMQAFPDAVEHRGPEGVIINPPPNGFKSLQTLAMSHQIHTSPHMHYRRWHFRTLHDERFRRNPDGTARVVFVRDAIVGR